MEKSQLQSSGKSSNHDYNTISRSSCSDEDRSKDLFEPSLLRFPIAILLSLTSGLNCFIQYTFVAIW